MKKIFYSVKVEDLMTREYWETVAAVDENDARKQVNNMYARHGGRAGEVRPATPIEIEIYYKWQEV